MKRIIIDAGDGQQVCRTCGDRYPDAGDGWDGECPTCADRTAAADEQTCSDDPPADVEFFVEWCINLTGTDPRDVARQALGIHRDPQSLAVVFHVTGPDGQRYVVDLEEDDHVS